MGAVVGTAAVAQSSAASEPDCTDHKVLGGTWFGAEGDMFDAGTLTGLTPGASVVATIHNNQSAHPGNTMSAADMTWPVEAVEHDDDVSSTLSVPDDGALSFIVTLGPDGVSSLTGDTVQVCSTPEPTPSLTPTPTPTPTGMNQMKWATRNMPAG